MTRRSPFIIGFSFVNYYAEAGGEAGEDWTAVYDAAAAKRNFEG